MNFDTGSPERFASRADALYAAHRRSVFRRTDRLFAWLMLFQWLAGIGAAVWISPRAWEGQVSQIHLHVWAAVFLGGAIIALPIALVLFRPGEALTRHTVAVGQMLTSALWIHLTGGRIETHFHVFGSLAFLAFYRDWRVLVSASSVVALDHWLRGIYWPQSVYGVIVAAQWRWLEHAAWVIFEDVFLTMSCVQGVKEMRAIASRQAQLEAMGENFEAQVLERTAQLRASEERFRYLSAASPIGIFQTDAEGRCTYVNARWEKSFGLSFEEGLGEGWARVVHPEDRGRLLDEWGAAVRDGREYEGEFRILPPDGSVRWIHGHAAALLANDGSRMGYVGTVEDVTARKRAELELREKSDALENAVEGISRLDTQGRYVAMNSAYATMLGFRPEELLGQPWQPTVQTDDRGLAADTYRRMLSEGRAEVDLRGVRKDGSVFPKRVSMAKACDEKGAFIGHYCFTKDITEHKGLEDQLRQSQKIEAVGRLAGGVAHDFNNLLTVILGYCEVLIDKTADPVLKADLEEIRDSGQRAASLTQQLLAFSRRQVLSPTVLDLNALVTDMDKMLRRLIGEDIDLLSVLTPGLGSVKADRGQIEQVVMNLAVNARDAMPSGGKLTLETQEVFLDADYAARHAGVVAGPHVMLAVSDTGSGMDEKTRSRLFEPFFTTKELGKGTGLGLATVYGIVKQSGGHIQVYSEVGQGTTFKIYLPRQEQAAAPATTAEPRPLRGSETVLLVEDEGALRKLTRQLLESSGYNVLECQNAEEAVRLAGGHRGAIDLLLTDVIMPGMTGPQLAERIIGQGRTTKVLYMSGYTDNAILHRGVLDTEAAFLQKPFRPSALLNRVREVLDVGSASARA